MEESTKKITWCEDKGTKKNKGIVSGTTFKKIDIDPKHLSRLEVGRSFPSLDTLEKLANALPSRLEGLF